MSRATFNQFMDVEGSSGQLFPNWEEAHAYYTAHYHRACMHILLPNFHNTKKKKARIVKSATPSTCHRRRRNSSCSLAGNYRPLYDEDNPVTPAVVEPALHPPPAVPAHGVKSTPDFHPTATASITRSPGTAGNPIEVFSNFPTPIAHQETPKRHKKAQRLGLGSAAPISPTPASVSLPAILTQLSESRKQLPHISNGPDSFVYVCNCSDGEGGYLAAPVCSLKHRATASTNNASSSRIQANKVIEIHTDSESDSKIRPFSQMRFCKCASLKKFLSSCAKDPSPDIDMDSIPEIPRPTQV